MLLIKHTKKKTREVLWIVGGFSTGFFLSVIWVKWWYPLSFVQILVYKKPIGNSFLWFEKFVGFGSSNN